MAVPFQVSDEISKRMDEKCAKELWRSKKFLDRLVREEPIPYLVWRIHFMKVGGYVRRGNAWRDLD